MVLHFVICKVSLFSLEVYIFVFNDLHSQYFVTTLIVGVVVSMGFEAIP